MKAVRYDEFEGPLRLVDVPDPAPPPDGVVVRVGVSGLCRSDWHGWMGHDVDVQVPHVPGHEFAGTVLAVGKDVRKWKQGDRITVPFSMGCGSCERCRAGDEQICDRYYQPGFTGWGSFAEYVALPYADVNLVLLPDAMSFTTAALLGCRFATAYRAVVGQGRTRPGEWVAVHGCGGVGLSATMIARALDARVIAVDITAEKLALARTCGAELVIDAPEVADVAGVIQEVTGGGAHVSIDALGSPATCRNSILSLRKRGRHIQVGLLLADQSDPPVPMSQVIARELEIRGTHGLQAREYAGMLDLIMKGRLHPEKLLGKTITLSQVGSELAAMDSFRSVGVTVAVVDSS
ncbi:MAG TPA: zinc-dependent alcohol dehydrogenase family protein [Gemmatimonadales bacterium]|nr:zinc-dependent alcohol dehydrogenase family protein [Gemmatimonadales bacterium]